MTSPLPTTPQFWETSAFWVEIIKLLLQFGGALVVARLTVFWALRRYKSEKMWERETTALIDVLSAIDAIDELMDLWFDEEVRRQEAPEDIQRQRRDTYAAERRKLRSVAAVGAVLLPRSAAEVVRTLLRELDRAAQEREGWTDRLQSDGLALATAREALVDFAVKRVQG
jgi:hypothetical protein